MSRFIFTAVGVALVGTAGVNYAYRRLQINHQTAEYCSVPVEMLKKNEKCIQLLGGLPIRVTTLNLKKSTLTTSKVKVDIPVSGNMRRGTIHTMSTRPDTQSSWYLQYAVFVLRTKANTRVVWLHPEAGTEEFEKEVPQDVTNKAEKS